MLVKKGLVQSQCCAKCGGENWKLRKQKKPVFFWRKKMTSIILKKHAEKKIGGTQFESQAVIFKENYHTKSFTEETPWLPHAVDVYPAEVRPELLGFCAIEAEKVGAPYPLCGAPLAAAFAGWVPEVCGMYETGDEYGAVAKTRDRAGA